MVKYYCDICGEPAIHGGILYDPVGTLKVRTSVSFSIPVDDSERRYSDLCEKHRIESLEKVIEYLKNPNPLEAGMILESGIVGPAGMCD
jgi:hypothetical protein